ncbi:3-isopropylmalate/(R)-2-methylmalate dehydratase small subunit [Humitalea rosea]|uniref:3-isopropylmalate dehydratase n=1 Tax=Humitalea rosea TaxID=990373 RepID=A0A2W7JAM2_9PROT|nr:3-isopropylmalate dehydratase small subunit [Humitalea rosea]PZW48432.1 3-isopropylmalate/(R)-2-methylmalate dehydratase small subunit [Humitalea rosea]
MPEPFLAHTGLLAPFARDNVDTDQLLPARFLRKPRDEEYHRWLFHDLRARPDGAPDPEFVLHRAPYDRATILVAGRNFGVGSSREAAVYALLAGGFRCVVASGFGDIFFQNALKNGLLPIRLEEETVLSLRAAPPGAEATVDLAAAVLTGPDGQRHPFTLPGFARDCLLRGVDEIGYTLGLLDRITAWEAGRHSA